EAAAAMVLGQGHTEQVGSGQLGPQLAVEAVVGGLDCRHSLRRRPPLEDGRGRVADRVLLLGEGEVHQRGLNIGSVSSSSIATNSTSTGRPTRTSAGSMPMRSETSRVPSSSSTRPTGSG